MSEKAALVEMETLNRIIMINSWINECSSGNTAMQVLITKTRELATQMLEKQRHITTTTVVREARDVDLSVMESRKKVKGGDLDNDRRTKKDNASA